MGYTPVRPIMVLNFVTRVDQIFGDFLGISITYKITTDVATFWQLLEIIGLLLGIIRLLFKSRLVTLVTTLADQKRTERK